MRSYFPMEYSIFTNEFFLIFVSLFYWLLAIQEKPINKFVSVRDILKIDLPPSTIIYIDHFLKPGLVGVELFWSAVSIAYVVFNTLLLVAIGCGPFKLLLYPSLAYLELVTNAVLLLGRKLACHASSADPTNLACVIFSSTKIIGLAVVMYRWLNILWLWKMRKSKKTKAVRFQKTSPIIREGHRANIEKFVRRRLTQTHATESMVRTQISLLSRNRTRLHGERDSKIWHRTLSQSSLIDVLVCQDWSRVLKDNIFADVKERLMLHASTDRLDDSPSAKSIEENRQLESERKDLRDRCRVVCLAMAPESVVHSWLQNLPINPVKAQTFYDDWKYLIADAMASYVDSGANDIYDDYNMLDMLCRKVMEYRGGPRISQSLSVLEDEDIRENKHNSKTDSKIRTVESEMFAHLADRVLQEAMNLKRAATLPTETSRTMNDKSIQVNTISDKIIQKYWKMKEEKRLTKISTIRDSGANNIIFRINIRIK